MNDAPVATSSRTRVWVGLAIGLLLIGAAAWVIARQRAALRQAIETAADAPWWMVASLLLLPAVNLWLTGMQFWVLTGRYGRVPCRDMLMLISSGWLLNTLPLRGGLFGRIAYHKAVHGIAVRDSVRVLIRSLVLAIVALALLLAMTLAAHRLAGGWVVTAGLLLAPMVVSGLASMLIRASRRETHAWREPAGLAFRYLDMLGWTARYLLVFSMIGKPIGSVSAAAVAIAAQAAMLAPVQLGVREWVVGLVAALLPEAGSTGISETTITPGLMADLVNRGAEFIVLVPVGSITIWWLFRSWGRRNRTTDPAAR